MQFLPHPPLPLAHLVSIFPPNSRTQSSHCYLSFKRSRSKQYTPSPDLLNVAVDQCFGFAELETEQQGKIRLVHRYNLQCT